MSTPTITSLAARIGGVDPVKPGGGAAAPGSESSGSFMDALKGLKMPTPFGPIEWRALDHQSTMGAYVGQLAKRDGKGVMVNWRYADGARFLPSDAEVRALRKD